MPVIRVDNYFDAYRLRSHADDIHELAARPDKKFVTEFVNRKILEYLQPQPGDLLVDIGCGDGSLLRMLSRDVTALGLVGTSEEEHRIRSTYPGLVVKAGDMRAIPLDSGMANKIVCNAALFYMTQESEIRTALSEIKRIASPNALIFIGEIPELDEYRLYGQYRGNSMTALLWHILRRNGIRAFLGMIRRWWRASFGRERIVLNSAGIFYAAPEKMREITESCGLIFKDCFRHKEVDKNGIVVDSPSRYDYLFTV